MPTPDTVHPSGWWSGLDGSIQTLMAFAVPILVLLAVVAVLRHAIHAAGNATMATGDDTGTTDADDTGSAETPGGLLPFDGFDPDMYGPPQ